MMKNENSVRGGVLAGMMGGEGAEMFGLGVILHHAPVFVAAGFIILCDAGGGGGVSQFCEVAQRPGVIFYVSRLAEPFAGFVSVFAGSVTFRIAFTDIEEAPMVAVFSGFSVPMESLFRGAGATLVFSTAIVVAVANFVHACSVAQFREGEESPEVLLLSRFAEPLASIIEILRDAMALAVAFADVEEAPVEVVICSAAVKL